MKSSQYSQLSFPRRDRSPQQAAIRAYFLGGKGGMRYLFPLLFILLLVATLVFVPHIARAASPLSLDTSYGNGGLVNTPVEVSNAIGKKLILQSDGKAVIGGVHINGSSVDWEIARYNTDGSIDTSFGTNGIVTHGFAFGSGIDGGVGIQSSGKITAAGGQVPAGILIGRFNPDGSVDTTFGTNGFTSTPISNASHVVPFAQKVQPNDKIIVVGYAGFNNDSNSDLLLVRYNSDGSIDQTFGTGGIVLANYPAAQYHQTYAVALQSDGKIIVFGSLGGVGGDPLVLYRFNSDGSLDTTFGNNGIVYDHFGSFDFPHDIVVQSDGKIVVSGAFDNGSFSNKTTFVIRYNSD